MYVTRPRSLYKSSPEAINEATPEGPNSGILVIGRSKDRIKAPPLPQNKILSATYDHRHSDHGHSSITSHVLFISVINQPLSSNRYYIISAEGDDQGLAYESSTEEDRKTSCFCCSYIASRNPRRLNPLNLYQQFGVTINSSSRYRCCKGKSVAPDGVVTNFLGHECDIYPSSSSKHKSLELTQEASGLDSLLRNSLPSFDFPLSRERTPPVVVGKWICPFMFIREGKPKDRMKKSPFYEMTLEQRWERLFTCENIDEISSVEFKVLGPTEVVFANGKEAIQERNEDEGVLWIWIMNDQMQNVKVGLSLLIEERMIWEQERFGWIKGDDKEVMVEKMEIFREEGIESSSWRRYGCYVLVERFVLKRMDGSLVFTYEFKHMQRMKSKWE